MSSLGISTSDSRQTPVSSFHGIRRNLFRMFGFEAVSGSIPSRSGKRMLQPSHSRGFLPSMPRDYLRRRRAMRRISNVVMVLLLSAAVAYAIVHVSGPGAFSAPHP